MKEKRTLFLALAALSLIALPLASGGIDPEIFKFMKARSIGPANMSGRIGAIDAVASNPNVIWVGGAAGGVWKSEDHGTSWTPLFDDQPVSSIGAIAVNQSNPSMVWVGTGEAAPRNSVSVGRGVYLTMDGGKTWKCLGLEKTDKICKILLDPRDPNVAYVGALGPTWSEGSERGLYRTSDGGKTWEKVLYVNEKTGVADMAMDPKNPNRILVATWEHRRLPWFFTSGGPGSGLYLTLNGGRDWKKLTDADGLPKGELGRCGVAFAPSRSSVAYALVEAKKSLLLRSSDGGFTWAVVNDRENIHNRPFYYSRIWVNPTNENILYMLSTQFSVSEDGGKNFTPLATTNQAHSDHHALWIAPDGEMMVAGNDGGVVISHNRGKTWQFVYNLPLGQYYHVNVDMDRPYNLYGGLQDNGTWRGPAYSLTENNVQSTMWKNVGWGDGFDSAPDPENNKAGYGMSQGGSLFYFDTLTGSSRSIVPTESSVKHRYNWNAGFAIDPFKPATIYLGSQFVHRSPDRGRTWEIISPDLTTNDSSKQKQMESGGLTLDVSSAENHTTITTIAPSPLKEGQIWVGTDDGNVQLTRDAGKTWELVSKALTAGKKPLAPPQAWVTHIEASKFDAAKAYVVFDDHRRGNWTPYVLCTLDYGRTWKNIAATGIDGFAFCIEEDTVKPDILFVGTEFGLYFSLTGGSTWSKWTAGVPTTPVHDIVVHPRENDLVIATHGRSLFIVDDISPLREMSEELTHKKLHLFKIPNALQLQQGRTSSYMAPGDSTFIAPNKPQGMAITYFLIPVERKEDAAEAPAEAPAEGSDAQQRMMAQMPTASMARLMGTSSRVSITILDAQGKIVGQVSGTENRGINRVYWNMREPSPQRERERSQAGGGGFFGRGGGLTVLPGAYTVKIKYDDAEASLPATIEPDPRLSVDIEVQKANYAAAKSAQSLSVAVGAADRRLQETRKAIQTVLDFARANRSPKVKDLVKAAQDLDAKVKALQEELNPTPPKQGMADRSSGLNGQVMSAVFGLAGSGTDPISQAALVRLEKTKAKAQPFLEKVNQLYAGDVENFKKALSEAGFSLFGTYEPLIVK